MSMDELDRALAAGIQQRLVAHQITREDLARMMCGLGFRWTGNTVSQITTGRRSASLLEVGGLCQAFRVTLAALVDDQRVSSMCGDFSHWQTIDIEVPTEVSTKAARLLQVSPAAIDSAAVTLWGRKLKDERDRRLSDLGDASPRSLQARRGHATRALLAELEGHFARYPQ